MRILSLLEYFSVTVIPSGCCGMAGSLGYDAEDYEVSMNVGELVLFPAVRDLSEDVIVAAMGTIFRNQIHDGTGWKALHRDPRPPFEIRLPGHFPAPPCCHPEKRGHRLQARKRFVAGSSVKASPRPSKTVVLGGRRGRPGARDPAPSDPGVYFHRRAGPADAKTV